MDEHYYENRHIFDEDNFINPMTYTALDLPKEKLEQILNEFHDRMWWKNHGY